MNELYLKMLHDRGPLAEINFGEVPVHYNPGLPHGNKGIDWETGILLANYVEQFQPKQIVELGTFRGYSTAWLLLGMHLAGKGRLDTYDVLPEKTYGEMWYDHYALPKENFEFHWAPEGVTSLGVKMPVTIDLLFHDTAHELSPTIAEIQMLAPRISVGGFILIDDMLHPSYYAMQSYLTSYFYGFPEQWKWTVLPLGHGLGIAHKLA